MEFVYYVDRQIAAARVVTMNSTRQTLVFTIILVLVVATAGVAQDDAAYRLRLAQQLEQSGEYERARQIYETLARTDPTNFVYFDGLRRVYIQLKEYNEAIELVRQRLVLQKEDPILLTSLGALHYQAGRPNIADSLWNAVLATNPMNPALYRVVANQMIEFRLYEEAAAVYRRAREATGTRDLFGEDLAVIYGALQQYEAAVREYILLVKRNPMQLPLAQSKIAALTTTLPALETAFSVVRDAVEEDPGNPSLRMLLASIAIEAHQYDIALREVRVVDRLKNANGGELYSFAQRALQEGAYDAADQAYREIVDGYPGIPLVPYAKLGRVRCAEERLASADTTGWLETDERLLSSRTALRWPVRESASGWNEVISMYETLAAEVERTTIAAQCRYRAGTIAFEKLFDLDHALRAFTLVQGMREGGDLMVYARLSSARVMTAQNRIAEARAAYLPLSEASLGAVRSAAQFELAELDYFEALFDTALAVFQALGSDVREDIANDALKYVYFIQENFRSAPAALGSFARADLLARQQKFSEALALFKEIWHRYPSALLCDMAALRTGELELAIGSTDSALATFRWIADSMSISIVSDRALLLSAQAYERLRGDRVQALATYEELLERFPASIYAERSRQRIRTLRGDAL